MINIRELEIREESLSLTVTAYEAMANLNGDVDSERKGKLMDESFRVSSLLAEAFRTKQNEGSERDIKIGLVKLLELKKQFSKLVDYSIDCGASIERFLHQAEELQVELTELLSAIRLINADFYSPKLESTCI